MQATNEIRNILAKGQAVSGANPLAFLDGVLSGDPLEALAGGVGTADSSAAYAKAGKLRTETEVVPLSVPFPEAVAQVKSAAARLGKDLLALREAPTAFPFVAYFSKGVLANPTVVVVEVRPAGDAAQAVLTAFTTKVGFVQGYSCSKALAKFASLLR
ncbi:hypothetical protein C1878_03330 [Gordonibacter sp. 28C]|uniref:hypothetical protein n=1 Tax=Gordonibacter sp. 28C TaxID=2078569 RepID=UPI000DF7CBED|nr:hypothetical protein [Gordonibacter sp. 28C]RDB63842.1 hypothetical protein C1878_03330 [Gordonibacter sp. 28C]